MYQFILLIHVLAAFLIVALVLVQQGKGATVGAAFGSGASQTVFGSRGSGSFLFRVTFGFAIIFFATSIALNYIAAQAYKEQKSFGLMPLTSQQQTPAKSEMPPIAPAKSAPAADTPVANPSLPAEIPIRK